MDGRGVDSYGSGLGQAAVCFEHGNENLCSVIADNFLLSENSQPL